MCDSPATSSPDQGQVKIYGNSKLSDRVSAFQKTVVEKQSKFSRAAPTPAKTDSSKATVSNFSSSDTARQKKTVDLNDPNYGRPVEGSKTDKRGKAAAVHIGHEILQLCSIIKEYGKEVYDPDYPSNGPYYMITFKELFDMYTVISNKVVGCLLRARKHGLVDFEGEMLFQRRDDDVLITLIVDPNSIQADQDSTACIKAQ